jgi:hypothetical protein
MVTKHIDKYMDAALEHKRVHVRYRVSAGDLWGSIAMFFTAVWICEVRNQSSCLLP